MADKSKKRNEKEAARAQEKAAVAAPAAALPLASLRNEIDRLFERVAGGWPAAGGTLGAWDPFTQEPFKSWASSFGAERPFAPAPGSTALPMHVCWQPSR